ncbi:hypothetical protein [Micromonospora sp. NBC_00617]
MTVNGDTFERATDNNRPTHHAQAADGDPATHSDRVIDHTSAIVISR